MKQEQRSSFEQRIDQFGKSLSLHPAVNMHRLSGYPMLASGRYIFAFLSC
jgi:hypothetical protein